MRLALECPNYLLKDIQPLVDFDWILTHLVLEDEVYARHYRESKNFKVLDNSVNELLEPCSLEDMERAAEYVSPDLIVPPDHLGDFEATKESLEQGLSLWGHDTLLPVVQGDTTDEALDCAYYYDVKLGFNSVAVPYDITCKRTDSRYIMAVARDYVVQNLTGSGLEVHLLGFTTVDELVGYQDNLKVKSVDTGVPVLYGMNLKHLDEPWDFKKDKPTMSQMVSFQEFMDTSIRSSPNPSDRLSAIFWNICYLRKIIRGAE